MADHPIVGLPVCPTTPGTGRAAAPVAEAIVERFGAGTTLAFASSLDEAAEDARGDG